MELTIRSEVPPAFLVQIKCYSLILLKNGKWHVCPGDFHDQFSTYWSRKCLHQIAMLCAFLFDTMLTSRSRAATRTVLLLEEEVM